MALHEGAAQVLHHRESRGAAAGQDDRPRAQQVLRPLQASGRANRADYGQTGLRANVLIQLGGCEGEQAKHRDDEMIIF